MIDFLCKIAIRLNNNDSYPSLREKFVEQNFHGNPKEIKVDYFGDSLKSPRSDKSSTNLRLFSVLYGMFDN